jgi:hypothetical protein
MEMSKNIYFHFTTDEQVRMCECVVCSFLFWKAWTLCAESLQEKTDWVVSLAKHVYELKQRERKQSGVQKKEMETNS